ncbi:MAG: hypothetical protein ABFD25_16745 [Clostridiaceae bacterium]
MRKNVYDKEKKQPRKINGAYWGRITPASLDIEYCASKCLYDLSPYIRNRLEAMFPEDWKGIYALALLRTIKRKNMLYE